MIRVELQGKSKNSFKEIEWLSPLSSNNYLEYRDDFIERLGFREKTKILREFWPENGPSWDGLARLVENDGLSGVLLVEAKSHLTEMNYHDRCGAKSSKSKIQLKQSLDKVKNFYEVANMQDTDWMKRYYQFANRLAFLFWMNEVAKLPTWLVLVCFLCDYEMRKSHTKTENIIPESRGEWAEHIGKAKRELGLPIRHKLADRLLIVCPQAITNHSVVMKFQNPLSGN